MKQKLEKLLRKKFPYHTDEQIALEVERRLPPTIEDVVVNEPPKTSTVEVVNFLGGVKAATSIVEEDIGKLAEQNLDVDEEDNIIDTDEVVMPDDLTVIKGIGKKLQEKLNAVGITTFQEIADLTPEGVKKVAENLDFKGRIEYEDWIEQAKGLVN